MTSKGKLKSKLKDSFNKQKDQEGQVEDKTKENLETVKQILLKEFGEGNVNAKEAQIAKLCEKAWVEKKFEEATDFLKTLTAAQIHAIRVEADRVNREQEKEKHLNDIKIALESKDVDHAQAVTNEFYRQYASPEEMEEVSKLFPEEDYCYYKPQFLVLSKKLVCVRDPEYAKENNLVYLSKNKRKRLAREAEARARAEAKTIVE